MKFIFALSLVLVSCAAFHLQNDESEFMGRSFIDPIIKAILEGMRPKFANLTIPDINEKIKEQNINATISIRQIELKKLDKFIIRVLKSDLTPLRLTNLTLFWDEITFSALYNVNINVRPKNSTNKPINLFGDGKAKAKINSLFLTVGANLEMKNKAIQIKPKGLFGFDVNVKKADVSLSSLMNSTELGTIVGNIISRNIPNVVDEVKKPLFNAFQDDIINIINNVLKKNGTTYDDEMELPAENNQIFLDLLDNFSELNSEESAEESIEY